MEQTEQRADPTIDVAHLTECAVALQVRRIAVEIDETLTEGGRALAEPVTRAVAFAVVRNPWIGRAPEDSLHDETVAIAPVLAGLLSERLLTALGGADRVEAFGKAAVVGLAGELEHAGALIHTPYFGNLVRELLGGTSIICFSDSRADAGVDLRVPLWHKTHAATRSHYQSLDVHLADAPHADEIVVIAAASTGGRPHPRIGDRTTDLPITSEILKGIRP